MYALFTLVFAVLASGPIVNPAVITTQQQPYQLSHRFTVEIDGVTLPAVQSIDGLQNFVVQYRESDLNWVTRKRPGSVKWSTITLKRGLTRDNTIFVWRQSVIEGKVNDARKTVTLHTFTPLGYSETFTFHKCLPTKYARNAVGETVDLSCDSFDLK